MLTAQNRPVFRSNEMRYKRWRECEQRSCKNLKDPAEGKEQEKTFSNQCDCKMDYYRDCGRCVTRQECDQPRICRCKNPCRGEDTNELRCVNICTLRTCASAVSESRSCRSGCYNDCDCVQGLWLNANRQCVKQEDCSAEDISVTAAWVLVSDLLIDE